MTPEQQDARTRRLVSAARALLALQVGLYVGAKRIENSLIWLGPDFQAKHRIFSEFTSAVPRCLDSWDHVPIRSWPLFKARNVLRTLFQSDFSLATR